MDYTNQTNPNNQPSSHFQQHQQLNPNVQQNSSFDENQQYVPRSTLEYDKNGQMINPFQSEQVPYLEDNDEGGQKLEGSGLYEQRYYFHDYNTQNEGQNAQQNWNENNQKLEEQQKYYFQENENGQEQNNLEYYSHYEHTYQHENDQNKQEQSNQQYRYQTTSGMDEEGENKQSISQQEPHADNKMEGVTEGVQTKQDQQEKQQRQRMESELLQVKLREAEMEELLRKQKELGEQKQKEWEREKLLYLEKEKQRQRQRELQREKQTEREKERKEYQQRQKQRQKEVREQIERDKQLQKQVEKQKKILEEKKKQLEQQKKIQKEKQKQLQKSETELQKEKEKLLEQEKENKEKQKTLLIKEQQLEKDKKQAKQVKEGEVIKKEKKKKKKQKEAEQKQVLAISNTNNNTNNSNDNFSNNDKSQKVPSSNPQNDGSSPPPPPPSASPAILPPPPVQTIAPALEVVQIQQAMIIKQAQRQRIESTLKLFIQYMSKHKLHINNQKSVIINVYQQIDRRKATKYVWYHLLKEYLTQYQNLAKNFHETSYKIFKEDKIENKNKYLNIGEELKQGTDQLVFLRKQSGNDYNRINDYIGNKINLELEVAFNKFISEMNKSQFEINEKKKAYLEMEEQFKKRTQKLTKVYNRGREGKNQEEDVFVQTCKFITFEREFRQSLVTWGKALIDLRKIFITLEQKLNQQVQIVLNAFKNAQATLYSFHDQKFQKIIHSRDEILRQDKFGKLCALADTDYIKYAIEVSDKNQLSEVEDKDFVYFVEMPHFQIVTGKSSDLLKGMVNKSFQLKNVNEELINTISGNLVQFNRVTSQYLNKFIVKNLSATIVADGVVQFDQLLPGIIFNENRTVRLNFKDQDRAQQLICLLNEKTQP